MALTATIYKANLTLSDMDRGYYATHSLTLAQHPSETLERMMLRIVAFALHASETLSFTRGLSADDEPELWQKNYADEIELWVELGEPDEKRLKKACSRSEQVALYSYGGRASEVWWSQIENKLARLDKLSVFRIDFDALQALAAIAERSMQLTATIQDGQLWLANDAQNILIAPLRLK
ncbi:YaeQ family protein [Chromobacterium sp. IIBBL 290-4]|uniref:YaeQ family protein n=1 Tax=Chromobacterium sp. IIBBL 290-4 TaxID=2953890 RepID=UPI0020B64A1B|nr:YaeQ family protein [Chromobacterium sp. IIBBL 290-4]UTH76057.1 YaeQ family protein [Chromobacterium sp. IIBBL 290-4]